MRKLRRAHLHDGCAGPHWAVQGWWQGLGEAETGLGTGHHPRVTFLQVLESRGRFRAIHCNLQPARPSARLRNLSTPSTLAQLLPTMACLREVDSQSVSPRLLVSGRLESGAPLLPRLKARDSQMEPRSRTGAPFRPATLPGDVIGGQSKPLSTVTPPSSAQCSLLTASASLAQGAISALAVGHLSIRDGLTLQQSTSQHSQMLPLAPGELIGIMASPWSPASAQTRSSVRICLAVRSLRYIGRGT